MQSWRECQNPQLLHSSEHKMRLLVWWPALDSKITSPQHFNNYTGCQYNIASPSNFVYSCTEYTRNEPSYLTDKVTATADLQSRAGLRSASTSKYQTPRTRIKFGERSFCYAGPSAWNSLPQHIREITDTTRFKRHLKTVLFQRAFLDF